MNYSRTAVVVVLFAIFVVVIFIIFKGSLTQSQITLKIHTHT